MSATHQHRKTNISEQFKTVPSLCLKLIYFSLISRYVKVPEDACYDGDEEKYKPRHIMCPIPSKFYLRLLRHKITL